MDNCSSSSTSKMRAARKDAEARDTSLSSRKASDWSSTASLESHRVFNKPAAPLSRIGRPCKLATATLCHSSAQFVLVFSNRINCYLIRAVSIDAQKSNPLIAQGRHQKMAIMDPNAEQDVMKLWQLVVDLSEQLTQTKQVVSSLYSESQKLKVGEDCLAPLHLYLILDHSSKPYTTKQGV